MSFIGECRDLNEQHSNLDQRKRILPSWMLQETLIDQNLIAPVIPGGNSIIQESVKRGICKNKTPVNITRLGRKRLSASGDSGSISVLQDPRKKCQHSYPEGLTVSSKEVPQPFSATSISNIDVNAGTTSTQKNKAPPDELHKVPQHKSTTEVTPSNDGKTVNCSGSPESVHSYAFPQECHESSSGPSGPETLHSNAAASAPGGLEGNKVRASCMYGASCYRKNPVHFEHFSHPGDSDYGGLQVTGRGGIGNQPECPYGASCYRKNPQHKIEYRHSTLPARTGLEEDGDDVGQPSEYDLEDEEEEYESTDEDSDWQPEKEHEDKEDVEELLKEAKKFMRRRK